jgi:tape measure domain-containing protein
VAVSSVKLIVDAANAINPLKRVANETAKTEKQVNLLKKAIKLQGAAIEAVATKLSQFGDMAKAAFGKAQEAAQKYQSTLGGLKGAIVSLGVAALTKRMIGQAASFAQTQVRLKALSNEYGEFGKIQQLVKDNAKTFNQSQAESASNFSDVYARLRPLGTSLEDIQTVYKGFNATALASGTSAAAASGAFLQLSQALGSGRLQGDEFRSIAEQVPGILRLVADEMGVTVGELKKLGSDGMITSDILINSLAKGFEENKDKIQALLAESPAQKFKEFSNATSELSNAIGTELLPVVTPAVEELTKLLKAAGDLPGPIKTAGAALIGLSAVVLALASPVSVLVKGIAALAPAATAATGAAKLLAGAMVILKVAMLALPWVALAAGITAIGVTIYNTTQEKKKFDELLRSGSVEELSQKSDELAGELLKAENRLIALRNNGISPVSRAFKQQKEKVEELQAALKAIEGTYKVRIEIEQLFKGGTTGEKLPQGYSRAADGTLVYTVAGVTYEASSGDVYKPPAEKKTPSPKKKKKGTGRTGSTAKGPQDISAAMETLLLKQQELRFSNDQLAQSRIEKEIQIQKILESQSQPRQQNIALIKADNDALFRQKEIFEEMFKAPAAIDDKIKAGNLAGVRAGFAAGKETDDKLQEQAKKLDSLYKGIGDTIQTGIVDAIGTGVEGLIKGTKNLGESLQEIASGVLADIGKQLLSFGVKMGLQALTGGTGLEAMFRADGGPVNSGQPYIVGERGPELMIPSTSGMVLSNSETRQQLTEQGSAMRSTEATRQQLNTQRNTMITNSTRETERMTEMMLSNPDPIDVRYESTVINNVEYVTAEQHRQGMAQAAERGRSLTLSALQGSVKTRKKVGLS